MMSNNHRSTTVINDHLPIEETSGEYSSDRKRLEKMAGVTYLLKNQLYMYKTDG